MKNLEQIQELETLVSLTNAEPSDDYYRGAKGVAVIALSVIKELEEENPGLCTFIS